MINQWYTTKVRFTKELTDGTLKRVSELYCISANSFTDCEARVYKEVAEHIRGEFVVQAMAKIELAELFFYDDSEIWFKCKIKFSTEDADTGREKSTTNVYLLTAHTAAEANV